MASFLNRLASSVTSLASKAYKGGRGLASKVSSGFTNVAQKAASAANTVVEKVVGLPHSAIDATRRFYAWFANQVYKGKGSRSSKDDYSYVKPASTNKLGVWVSPNEIVIGVRGTVIDDAQDIKDDAAIVLGREDLIGRADDLVNTIDTLQQRYGGRKVVVSGHSLGGAIVHQALKSVPSELVGSKVLGYSFNPGVADVKQDANWRKGLHISHITGDPISVLARGINAKSNKTYRPAEGMNPHTIQQFL